jgi:hypothetical protein
MREATLLRNRAKHPKGYAMNLFDLLLVAHFVGDWMFQTNWMAAGKRGRPRSVACLSHCLAYTVVVGGGLALAAVGGIAALAPGQAAGAALFIFVTHWLIDGFNLPRRWNHLVNRADREFVLIVVDQTMHLVTLAAVAWWVVRG